MNRQINPNFLHLRQSLNDKKTGAILEGSTRSGKTWASIYFLLYICTRVEVDTQCTIHILKETYNSYKTTLFDDFNRILPLFGIPSPFEGRKEISTFWILGHKINLLGADSSSTALGSSCDYLWANELLDVQKEVFNQKKQRCRKFWWGDYNPKYTDHYVYDSICTRSDVSFLKTTFLDNPHITRNEKIEVLAYEPTHPDDRDLPEEKRRPHPINIKQGTADKYMWKVYGLGERSAREGLIFPNVTWIDVFPSEIERETYGMDFGYTNDPTALVHAGLFGKNLYLDLRLYEPTENVDILEPLLSNIITKKDRVWADSENPGMISDLRKMGYLVLGVRKFKGSIVYGIDLLKRFKIHIVRSPEFRKEQENYAWKMFNGIKLNVPEDKHNHAWDASRYAVMSEFR